MKTMSLVLISISTLAFACGNSGSKAKGGGSKGTDAMSSGQQAGGAASGGKASSSSEGETYEGVTCDDSTDGLAWCDSDTEVAFCSDGEWWLLDCGEIGADFCAEDDSGTVDCYAADEF